MHAGFYCLCLSHSHAIRLFRFPLTTRAAMQVVAEVSKSHPGNCRTEALAAASEIKHTAYSPADVMALFAAFQRQAAGALLFLKYVASFLSQMLMQVFEASGIFCRTCTWPLLAG